MKRVDFACYMAVEAVVNGTFTAGVTSLGLKEGGVAISDAESLLDFIDFGVGYGKMAEADRAAVIANWTINRATVEGWIWDAVDQLEAGILSGTIVVPTADTGDEIAAVRAQYTLGAP
jgi:basic membrane lipoprotein Med (substrate-binding protein (PBP1-ABC) superfamily)